jgi:predicted nucleic acid-binding protein
MVTALFDTNVILDHIKGLEAARAELKRYDDRAISIITVIEVLVGTTPATEAAERALLGEFNVVPLDDQVAEEAATLRRVHRMKLPDAVIWASARIQGRLLVSRNSKDFPAGDPGVRIPYRV